MQAAVSHSACTVLCWHCKMHPATLSRGTSDYCSTTYILPVRPCHTCETVSGQAETPSWRRPLEAYLYLFRTSGECRGGNAPVATPQHTPAANLGRPNISRGQTTQGTTDPTESKFLGLGGIPLAGPTRARGHQHLTLPEGVCLPLRPQVPPEGGEL